MAATSNRLLENNAPLFYHTSDGGQGALPSGKIGKFHKVRAQTMQAQRPARHVLFRTLVVY